MAEKEEMSFKKLFSIMNREQKNTMRICVESMKDSIDNSQDNSERKEGSCRKSDEDPENK